MTSITPTPTVTDVEFAQRLRDYRGGDCEYRALMDEAAARLTRSDDGLSRWQPIETAPKDQWLLTWDADGGHGILRHNDIFAMAGEEADGWMGATHWQPLPAPPKGIDHAEG